MPWLKKSSTATAAIPLTDQWHTTVGSSVVAYRSGDVVPAYTLPLGYRPAGLMQDYGKDSRGRDVTLNYNDQVAVLSPSASVSHHSFTFVTLDPMPKGVA